MIEENRREVTNPHDKITIDYTDPEAAQLAIMIIGHGTYGVDGDDGMPIFIFGGSEEWITKKYGKSLDEWAKTIDFKRIAKAMESMRIEDGERSSINDPVGYAHNYAKRIRVRKVQDEDQKP